MCVPTCILLPKMQNHTYHYMAAAPLASFWPSDMKQHRDVGKLRMQLFVVAEPDVASMWRIVGSMSVLFSILMTFANSTRPIMCSAMRSIIKFRFTGVPLFSMRNLRALESSTTC